MDNNLVIECVLAGATVRCRGARGQEQFRLNDIYRAAGSPANKDPRQWMRLPDAEEFLDFQAKLLNVGKSHIIQTRKGRCGGTWAYWAVAVKYAAYLDKKLEHEILCAWRQLKEEERDPHLASDMSFRRIKNHYIRRGCSEAEAEELAAQRLLSTANRNLLTSEWRGRGAKANDYPVLTNAGYQGLFKQTASELRKAQNLPVKANVRDYLPLPALAQTSLLEVLARERLQQDDAFGAEAMQAVSHSIGTRLAAAVRGIRSSSPTPMLTSAVEARSAPLALPAPSAN